MKASSTLVLGAHPDDEMGCSALISRLVRLGGMVEVLTFSRCRDLNPSLLVVEWNAALDILGVENRIVLDLPNRRLPEYVWDIRAELDKRRGLYDLVLCPSVTDVHQDHAAVAHEARRVFKGTTVLGYELPLNQVGATMLSAYAGISERDMEKKLAHAAAYQTQALEAYMQPHYIEALARVRGVQAGTDYAEAFEVIRWIM